MDNFTRLLYYYSITQQKLSIHSNPAAVVSLIIPFNISNVTHGSHHGKQAYFIILFFGEYLARIVDK